MQLQKCTLQEKTKYMEAQRSFADTNHQARGHKRSFDEYEKQIN